MNVAFVNVRFAASRLPKSNISPSPRSATFEMSQSGMTFLRAVISFHLFDLSMIQWKNRYPLFRIMAPAGASS
jgi:hypothetical protein